MKNSGVIEKVVTEKKEGRNYIPVFEITENSENGKERIYGKLMHALIAKKMHKCTYITRIDDQCMYDGTRKVTVYMDNGYRDVFIVEF